MNLSIDYEQTSLNILAFRKYKNYTQDNLAEKLGISRMSMRKIEHMENESSEGAYLLTLPRIMTLCYWFNCLPEQIISFASDKTSPTISLANIIEAARRNPSEAEKAITRVSGNSAIINGRQRPQLSIKLAGSVAEALSFLMFAGRENGKDDSLNAYVIRLAALIRDYANQDDNYSAADTLLDIGSILEIRKTMKALHMTNEEAGKRCGVTKRTFSRWLNRDLTDEEKALIILAITQKE